MAKDTLYNRKYLHQHPLYMRWYEIRRRCYAPTHRAYKHYGGRGIGMFDCWHYCFFAFMEIGVPPSPNHSLDRIDNNGPYAPWNVRWALPTEQVRNSRVTNLTIEDVRRIRQLYVKGVNQWQPSNASELAQRFGIRRTEITRIITGARWRE